MLPLLLAALAAAPAPASAPFHEVEPGLEAAIFDAPSPSTIGDSKIHVVRVDPSRRRLRLVSVKAQSLPRLLDASAWAGLYSFPAVINAGMFSLDDGRSPVGFAKLDDKVFVSAWNPRKNFQAVLAFDPKEKGLPPVRIFDTLCEDAKAGAAKYRVALQSIRMVDCRGKNHWDEKKRKWSAAFVGLDGKGRVLFVHARSPWTPSAFIDLLLSMPALDLKQAIYMEGGPEASLVLGTKAESWAEMGSFETGFNENDDNHRLWDLPNVIGVEPLETK
jgi:hypothetical protein